MFFVSINLQKCKLENCSNAELIWEKMQKIHLWRYIVSLRDKRTAAMKDIIHFKNLCHSTFLNSVRIKTLKRQ